MGKKGLTPLDPDEEIPQPRDEPCTKPIKTAPKRGYNRTVSPDDIRFRWPQMDKDERIFDLDVPLTERCMLHLGKRMLFADDYLILAASIGAHLADLQQASPAEDEQRGVPGGKDAPFYFYRGMPETLNVPVVLIQPSGFTKSFSMKQWFGKFGICPLPWRQEGFITEAGLVCKEGADGEIVWGAAHEMRDGFVVFNEITHLFTASKTQHSGALLDQVMEALSERNIGRTLGNIEVRYDTNMTMWGAVQPKRFDSREGLARRCAFLTRRFVPGDIDSLKQDRFNSKMNPNEQRMINMAEVRQLRKEIHSIWRDALIEQPPVWDETMLRYIHEHAFNQLDTAMIEKSVVGFAYLNQQPGTKVLKIDNSFLHRRLVDLVSDGYRQAQEGGEVSLMMSSIGKNEVSYSDLWNIFRNYGYQLDNFNELVLHCVKMRVLQKKKNTIGNWVYVRNTEVMGCR